MATVILDVTTFPQTFTAGNFPLSTLNDGDWRLTITLTNASSNASWGGGNYFAIVVCNDLGGLWIYDDGGTRRIALFQNVSGSPLIVQTNGLVWSAGSTITIHVKNTTDELIITGSAGLTSGAGTYAFTGSTTGDAFGAAPLGVGVYGGGGFTWAGLASDIDDGVDGVSGALAATIAAITSSAAGTLAIAGASSPTIAPVTSAATGTLALAGSASPTIGDVTLAAEGSVGAAPGTGALSATIAPVTLSAAGAVAIAGEATPTVGAVTSSAAGSLTLSGALAATIGPVTLTASNAAALTLEDYAANRVLYGTAAGTCSITLTTGASTSILVVTGGRLADLATAPTDSEGNTYTAHGSAEEFADWPGYGLRGWICLAATGDASLVVSQQFGQTAGFDEVTIVGWAISGATYAVTPAVVERGNAATVQAGTLTTSAPAIAVQAWCGDATTGATSVVSISSGTLLDVSTLVDHPNGYVPIAIASETLAAPASHAPTWSHTPTQGAILWSAALQAAEGRLGALAATIGAVTLSSAGDLTSAGNLAATIAPVTSTAAGSLALTGSVGATIAPVTLAATGTAENRGALAATIEPITSVAAGALPLTGSVAATIAPVTVSAAGSLPLAGGLSASIGDVTVDASGDLEGGAVGTLAATLGPVTVAGAGSLGLTAAASPAVGAVTSAATGTVAIAGALAATVGPVTSSAAGGGPRVALPRTFTVSVGVSAAADFTVEVDP